MIRPRRGPTRKWASLGLRGLHISRTVYALRPSRVAASGMVRSAFIVEEFAFIFVVY